MFSVTLPSVFSGSADNATFPAAGGTNQQRLSSLTSSSSFAMLEKTGQSQAGAASATAEGTGAARTSSSVDGNAPPEDPEASAASGSTFDIYLVGDVRSRRAVFDGFSQAAAAASASTPSSSSTAPPATQPQGQQGAASQLGPRLADFAFFDLEAPAPPPAGAGGTTSIAATGAVGEGARLRSFNRFNLWSLRDSSARLPKLFTHKEQLRRSLLCVCLEEKAQEQPPRLGDALAQEIENLQTAVLPLLKGCSQAEVTAMRESLRRRADACSGGTTAASTPPPPLSAGIAGVPILALVYLRDEERDGNQKSNKIVYELRRKLLAYGGGCVGAVIAKATGTGTRAGSKEAAPAPAQQQRQLLHDDVFRYLASYLSYAKLAGAGRGGTGTQAARPRGLLGAGTGGDSEASPFSWTPICSDTEDKIQKFLSAHPEIGLGEDFYTSTAPLLKASKKRKRQSVGQLTEDSSSGEDTTSTSSSSEDDEVLDDQKFPPPSGKIKSKGRGTSKLPAAPAAGGRGGLPAPDALLGDWDPAAALDPGALGLLTKERLGHSSVARPLSAQAFLELNSNRIRRDEEQMRTLRGSFGAVVPSSRVHLVLGDGGVGDTVNTEAEAAQAAAGAAAEENAGGTTVDLRAAVEGGAGAVGPAAQVDQQPRNFFANLMGAEVLGASTGATATEQQTAQDDAELPGRGAVAPASSSRPSQRPSPGHDHLQRPRRDQEEELRERLQDDPAEEQRRRRALDRAVAHSSSSSDDNAAGGAGGRSTGDEVDAEMKMSSRPAAARGPSVAGSPVVEVEESEEARERRLREGTLSALERVRAMRERDRKSQEEWNNHQVEPHGTSLVPGTNSLAQLNNLRGQTAVPTDGTKRKGPAPTTTSTLERLRKLREAREARLGGAAGGGRGEPSSSSGGGGAAPTSSQRGPPGRK